jgi:hypothetical protein
LDVFPYGFALDAEVLLPVIVPAVLPLVPVGFVLVGLVLVGFALDSLDGDSFFSSVPRTSTRWLTYLDQSLVELVLVLDAIRSRSLLSEPLVPVAALCEADVSLVVAPLEPIETFVSLNCAPLVDIAAELVSEPAVAAVDPVPVVPVVLPIELALCRQPVTVTLSPVSD